MSEFLEAENIETNESLDVGNATDTVDDFADIVGDAQIEAESPEDTEETEIGTEQEEEIAQQDDSPTNDNPIDQTRSFAKRLNEKTNEIWQQAQEKIDSYIREAYDGQKDPFTGEVLSIKNEADFNNWKEQAKNRSYARQYGVSETEAAEMNADQKFIRKLREQQEKQERINMERSIEQQKIFADIQDFAEKNPTVNIEALLDNKAFLDYADGKLLKKSLSEIFSGFEKLVGNAGEAAVAKSASKSYRASSTGSSSTQTGSLLTPEQERNRLAWNRANPNAQISQKEFLRLKKGF